MADIIQFPGHGTTFGDIAPDKVLEGATGYLDVAIVVGVTHEGNFYFASSQGDGGETLWWLERAKHKLMQITDELEEGEL